MKAILTLNIGSSSVKFAIFEVLNKNLKKIYVGLIENIHKEPIMQITNHTTCEKTKQSVPKNHTDIYENSVYMILNWLQQNDIEIIAAGHRMVHCGTRYKTSVKLSKEVIDYLETLNPLAPLHQPFNIIGCRILHKKFPDLFQVVCFDTSFHVTCNQLTRLFAIPKKYTEEGIRRYGFHGLSYEYVVSQFSKLLPPHIARGKVIIMHLGNGCTMCAVKNKKSYATSIGLSAVDGLIMGTRCGSIDAGVLLYLMEHHKMGYNELTQILFKESGLLGVSGISSDMRDLLNSKSKDAKLAIDLFVYRIAGWIGTLTAELGGLDGLVFTAGIGEHAPYIREQVCKRCAWLGVKIDAKKNDKDDIVINAKSSKIGVYVIPTDEETTIAKSTLKLFKKK